MKKLFTIFLLIFLITGNYSQNKNYEAHQFIENAEITQINRDWNTKAEFRSGVGDIVSFFPIEVIDLKSNKKVKSLQMDMTLKYTGNSNNFKSS
ncbi:hypothetical protein [Flavobacterium sp. YO64]|uniref:hypothetical protein n=1 Tax=Flavobacterium sp. YO64 TaxID=394559 RepID=UPI00100B6E08|nr:hypothetical protein [Flavobacterium sp. YO64]RXM44727.1 hypothetical protein BOW57_07330 [Flavobacterium sp. YO64]